MMPPTHESRTRGVVYMLLSAASFSVMSMLVKVAAAHMAMGLIVFARALVTLVISWALVRQARAVATPGMRPTLLLRGFIGFVGLACYYIALGQLPLVHATLIQNATPVVTAVFAWLVLRETLTARALAAIVIGLGGVVTVSLGKHGALAAASHWWPFAVASLGTFFSAAAYTTVRRLARTENPLIIVMYFPLIATPLALPWALWESAAWPSPAQLGLLVAIGVATQAGQVYLTKGLALLPAGQATTIGYAQTLFAAMWGMWWFGERLGLTTMLGMVLIGVATLLVATVPKPTRPDHG